MRTAPQPTCRPFVFKHVVLTLLLVGSVPHACVAQKQRQMVVDSVPVTVLRALSERDAMRPIGAQVLSSGVLVVADIHGAMLDFYDSAGHPIHAATQRPMFRHIAWIGNCGRDSLFVWDLMREQMFVLDRSGALARQYSLQTKGQLTPPIAMSCSRSGIFAYQAGPSRAGLQSEGSALRGAAPVVIADANGHTLGRIEGVRTSEFVEVGGGAMPRPLGKATSLALSTDRIYVGTADSGYAEAYRLDGKFSEGIHVPANGEVTTARSYQHAVDDVVALVPPSVADMARSALAALPRPSTSPNYWGMLIDDDDLLWFVVSPPGEATRLVAINNSGEIDGELALPIAITPTRIGHDYVVGVYSMNGRDYETGVFRIRR